jgi:hypothetical protein
MTTVAAALAEAATEFQTFLNQTMPLGAMVGVVQPDEENWGVPVLTPVLAAEVLSADTLDGEVVFQVLFAPEYDDPEEQQGTAVLVTTTDPAAEVAPGRFLLPIPGRPGYSLFINTDLGLGYQTLINGDP